MYGCNQYLPQNQRLKAWQKWASMYVAKGRAEGASQRPKGANLSVGLGSINGLTNRLLHELFVIDEVAIKRVGQLPIVNLTFDENG